MKLSLKNTGVFGLALLGLVRCGGEDEPKLSVQRGVYNQPSIRVDVAPKGKADELLFERQGYVESQDRFVQMDILRRVSRGRLSEIFGDSAVKRDKQMIAVGLPLSAERSLEKLQKRHPEAYVVLKAFSRGVNQYIQEQAQGQTSFIRNYRRWTKNQAYVPAPWEPIDSVSVAESIAFFLSSNIQERIMVGKIANAYFPDLAKLPELFDMRAIENTFILDAGGARVAPQAATVKSKGKFGSQDRTIGGHCEDKGYPFPPCFRTGSYGSNNWVVSRDFAGGKQSFVANDPHLQLSFPNNFIELALDSTPAGGTFKMRGVNLPGVPGILIGHNQNIAWGFTNDPADVDDVYIDELSEDESQVNLGKSMAKIETVRNYLKIRNNDGTVREEMVPLRLISQHGTFVSDFFPELKPALDLISGQLNVKVALSYKWTGHAGTTEVAAILGLNRARNYDEFRSSLNLMQAGGQNIVFADTVGNIGYYSHGDYPVRKYLSRKLPPNVPLFGWMGFEWEPEYRQSVPEITPSSAKGRIVTANNDPYGTSAKPHFSDYIDYFGNGFDVGERALRITQLLDAKKGDLSLDDMKRIQTDTKDLFALRAIGLMAQAKVQTQLQLSPRATELKNVLLAYDGEARRERHEPVMVQAWLRSLGRVFFKELLDKYAAAAPDEAAGQIEADELFEELIGSLIAAKTIYHKMNDLLSMETPDPEAIQLIAQSLEMAAEKLENTSETWGQVNRLNFLFPLEGIFPKLTTAPIERSGSWATVNVAGKIHGPNFRMVMVLEEGKSIEGVNVLAGGNYSPLDGSQWLNELMLWRDGKYRDLVPFVK